MYRLTFTILDVRFTGAPVDTLARAAELRTAAVARGIGDAEIERFDETTKEWSALSDDEDDEIGPDDETPLVECDPDQARADYEIEEHERRCREEPGYLVSIPTGSTDAF